MKGCLGERETFREGRYTVSRSRRRKALAPPHSECTAMCICNMLLSSLCHAELLNLSRLEGWMRVGGLEPGNHDGNDAKGALT